jgi:hypothetical protein
MDESPTTPGSAPGHIPKRGARACTACRKGKNRCEGEVGRLSARAVPRPAHRSLARLYRSGPENISLLVVAVN